MKVVSAVRGSMRVSSRRSRLVVRSLVRTAVLFSVTFTGCDRASPHHATSVDAQAFELTARAIPKMAAAVPEVNPNGVETLSKEMLADRSRVLRRLHLRETADYGGLGCPGTTSIVTAAIIRERCPTSAVTVVVVGGMEGGYYDSPGPRDSAAAAELPRVYRVGVNVYDISATGTLWRGYEFTFEVRGTRVVLIDQREPVSF